MGKSFNYPNRRAVLAGIGGITGSLALSACYKSDEPLDHYDTIIIGAGLSGLHAAKMLQDEGGNILVLESSERVGGRIFTMDDVPSKPEAGGMEIGQMYARARSTIADLGLGLEPFPSSPPGMMINYDDHNTTMSNWTTWEHNPLPDDLKKTLPFSLMRMAMPTPNPLESLDSWLEKSSSQYDIPLSTYLEKLGDNDDIRKMINISLQGPSVDQISALGELRKARVGQFERGNGPSERIVGGASRLPEAMAASLQSEIIHNKKVTEVRENGAKTIIKCADGSEYSAGHVICTVPFSVLKNIRFDPGLPKTQQQAINEIPYLPSTVFYFSALEPFWEHDQLPPTMWTTSILERIFALASNTSPVAIFWGLINGNNALEFDKLALADQEQLILDEMARVRPSTTGKIKVEKIHSWGRYTHNRGAWAYWKPGQITKFGESYNKPHNNIHFAGEHTAMLAAGIEGAFETGERAAFEVLDI